MVKWRGFQFDSLRIRALDRSSPGAPLDRRVHPEAVALAEKRYDTDPSEMNLVKMKSLTAQWNLAVTIDEDFWHQKLLLIKSVSSEGVVLEDQLRFKASGVAYFQQLLTTDHPLSPPDWLPNASCPCDHRAPTTFLHEHVHLYWAKDAWDRKKLEHVLPTAVADPVASIPFNSQRQIDHVG
ncbi:hypothetical protein Salat_1702800, partial [Sesamum alatum]